jgi:hypothetical protein
MAKTKTTDQQNEPLVYGDPGCDARGQQAREGGQGMMEDCALCQEMLSVPVVLPAVFAVSHEQRVAAQRRVHERATRDGQTHDEAGVRLFAESFSAARGEQDA